MDVGVVYDVGANIGNWAFKARELFPTAHIVSFEPVWECFQELVRVGGADPRFWPLPFALSDHDGTTEFFVNQLSDASSMLEIAPLHVSCFPQSNVVAPTTVACRTLDGVAQHFAFPGNILVKLDVQGAEDRVIRGGLKTLSETSVVVCETSFVPLYDGQPLFHDILALLTPLGFRYMGAMGPALRSPHDDVNLEEDSIFVRI